MHKFELVKKISVKTVCGRPKIPENNKTEYLMEVFGVASGVKTGDKDGRPWYGFIGTFQGVNLASGQIYRSGVLFLPDVAGNLMLGQLKDEKNRAIEFAFRIGVKRDESTATGYTYVADPLLPVNENDPVEMLAVKLGKKALPGPVDEKKTAK